MPKRLIPLLLSTLLAGCDLQSVQALLADPREVQKEADAKAIGGACRHAMRSIEDCYGLNPKASKAAIFAGWREMDIYMRENKIEGVAPLGLKAPPLIKLPPKDGVEDTTSSDSKEKTGTANTASTDKTTGKSAHH
ncbi:hypothetical protein [Curvibacter sp. CHRR-16]|uniref:hypothetical protein n=1 Tax=Curvibacter sp. CHRR-16 TaxID=2835872 RepID=UPI002023A7D8|nr:hypothetical protein [Curvibacter sp. CHRR-16]